MKRAVGLYAVAAAAVIALAQDAGPHAGLIVLAMFAIVAACVFLIREEFYS